MHVHRYIPFVYRGGGRGGRGEGGSTAFLALGAFIFLMVVLLIGSTCTSSMFSSCASVDASSWTISSSTVEREKLSSTAVTETDYYTDEDGSWILSSTKLESGMKTFYRETGVQPYLYILPNGTTTSGEELTEMAEELYDELFEDQGHFLLVFCDNNNGGYTCGYWCGSSAGTVMDDEAVTILSEYLELYYDNLDLSEEELFSKTFESTADHIMSVTVSPLRYVAIIVAVIAGAGIIVFLVRVRRKQNESELEYQKELLSKPLETFGDKDLEDLVAKYESTTNSSK